MTDDPYRIPKGRSMIRSLSHLCLLPAMLLVFQETRGQADRDEPVMVEAEGIEIRPATAPDGAATVGSRPSSGRAAHRLRHRDAVRGGRDADAVPAPGRSGNRRPARARRRHPASPGRHPVSRSRGPLMVTFEILRSTNGLDFLPTIAEHAILKSRHPDAQPRAEGPILGATRPGLRLPGARRRTLRGGSDGDAPPRRSAT